MILILSFSLFVFLLSFFVFCFVLLSFVGYFCLFLVINCCVQKEVRGSAVYDRGLFCVCSAQCYTVVASIVANVVTCILYSAVAGIVTCILVSV